jgi:RNA polymerase sigma factor (sigma-70 family)
MGNMRSLRPADLDALPDAAVLAASLSDGEAFGVVFDRHFVAVHRYVTRRAGRVAADDVAAATFTVAFERRLAFRADAGSALPWLFGIATNLLHETWRDDRREDQVRLRLRGEPSAAWPSEPPDDGSELSIALAALDRDQRDVLLLFAWGELAYEEIAVALAIPLGTVRSRLHRARGALRGSLALTTVPREETR